MNLDTYAIHDFKEIYGTKLVLWKAMRNREIFPANEWCYEFDQGVWKDAEIRIDGNEESPDEQFVGLADQILKEFPVHLKRAFDYLHEFFPGQKQENYIFDSVWFGRFLMFQGMINTGFAMEFTYGVYPDAFQFRVKFREDGWPVGFEGGPL